MTDSKEFTRRTVRRRVTVVIDETGRSDEKDSEGNVFGVGAVITEDPETLEIISRVMRKVKGVEELKYRTNKRIRDTMEKHIAATDAHVVGVYVKKDWDVPPWWKVVKRRSWPQRLMMCELLKDLVALDVDFDKIIVDENTVWNNKEGTNDEGERIIKRYVGPKRKIGYIAQEDSKAGDNKDLMQTADFAIGAMGRTLRDQPPETPIKINSRRLK